MPISAQKLFKSTIIEAMTGQSKDPGRLVIDLRLASAGE